MNPCLLLCVLLVSAAAAESIRETETMDRRGFYAYESSGSLPDDEDIEESIDDSDYEDDSFEYGSGSGEPDDDIEATVDTPTFTMGNRIPEGDRDVKNTVYEDNEIINNEIIPNTKLNTENLEPSNEISLASTSNGSIFQRTEVVVALVAGALVGLLFAVFIIVAVIVRRNKIPNGSDSVKKPIYTKASTMEV